MNTLKAIKSIDWYDVATRACWTFLQTFLATVILMGESIINLLFDGRWDELWVLLIAVALAGVAAGLSAVKTIALELVAQLRGDL